MYKSPIEIMQTEMQVQMENGIMKAVQDIGINVDKAELLKALAYDREQYQKGFADGREAGHEWISVEDRLPERYKHVLVATRFTDEGTQDTEIAYFSLGGWRKPEGILYGTVTHWMPMPEPPEEG